MLLRFLKHILFDFILFITFYIRLPSFYAYSQSDYKNKQICRLLCHYQHYSMDVLMGSWGEWAYHYLFTCISGFGFLISCHKPMMTVYVSQKKVYIRISEFLLLITSFSNGPNGMKFYMHKCFYVSMHEKYAAVGPIK